VTFEDKRRENFEKGFAELERRRMMLLEQQKREADERLAFERREEEKQEKARFVCSYVSFLSNVVIITSGCMPVVWQHN